MARYTGAVCRLCRREEQKLFLKGERCYSDKCAMVHQRGPNSSAGALPGQHGQNRRRKMSEYGLQMRAKQKARRFYGVLESQFAKYFEMAVRQDGITGENLLRILESRMDNVVYRSGFASSRAEARIFVGHGHYTLNGKKMDIPSALLKPGDIIAVKDKFKATDRFKVIDETNGARPAPNWLDVDRNNAVAKVISLPNREDIDLEVEEHLIVERYSK